MLGLMEKARLPLKDCCRIVERRVSTGMENILLEWRIQKKCSLLTFSAHVRVISIQNNVMSAQTDIKRRAQSLCAVFTSLCKLLC
jgi:hypothetical protein